MGLASMPSLQRQDSLGPPPPPSSREVRTTLALTCPPGPHLPASAAVKETCVWFTDNYEQARK